MKNIFKGILVIIFLSHLFTVSVVAEDTYTPKNAVYCDDHINY
jgi:hypothetical protein